MDRGQTSWRSVFTSIVILIIVIGGCIAGMLITTNILCANSLREKLLVYPGAEIIWERHSVATTFGIGETYIMLESPDDPDTVHEWYNRYNADLLRNRRDNRLLYFGSGEWSVGEQEDGTGSAIVLHGVCIQ